jgi:chloride channel 3/4/5
MCPSFKKTSALGLQSGLNYTSANNNAIAHNRCMIMASSSAGYVPPPEHASSSSSNHSPPKPAAIEDDSDNDDPVASYSRDQALLSDDPLDADEGDIVSFKRKQKQTTGSRFLSALSGNGSNSRQATPSPRAGTPTLNSGRTVGLNTLLPGRDSSNNSNTKDGGPLDWYVEGPGRRVGYEDMTAIDWIFEYTKERQRLRMLYSNAAGLLGYARQFLDASQVWVVLILTGLAAGIFAASIDVASDWLGDIKTGYCSAGDDGGHFYLNKYFCCYGYDSWAQCQDWKPWADALHISSSGGKWFIEYFFFIIFSVSWISTSTRVFLTLVRSCLLSQQVY